LKCTNCGKEIQDEKSSFCAYCGTPLNSKPKKELTTPAGILALIAASFSAAIGTIGVVSYQAYSNYYASYGYDTSGAIGFIYLGAFAFIAAAFGFAAGILTLTRKRFKIAITGTILVIASTIFTLIATWYYNYGYTEGILLATVSTGALSIMSTIFIITSKTEFTATTKPTEPEPKENTETEQEQELEQETEQQE
jgi:glucan phosphoethanolaminetransferase (alkaline phosphatase superfamily)